MYPPPLDPEWVRPASWAGLSGRWTFAESLASYVHPENPEFALGIATTELALQGGVMCAEVTLGKHEAAGRLIFGHEAASGALFSAGVGGGDAAYVIDEYVPGRGWIQHATAGMSANLTAGQAYSVEVYLAGQLVWMEVDDVEVLRLTLPHPLLGHHIGAVAWSSEAVTFSDFRVLRQKAEAFVVMQFGGLYDELFDEVIFPTCEALGFYAYRADDVYAPGIILQDIITSLVRATVVVAEISPVNANVYYELGYAHALGKQTILLAQRGGQSLPFDVSGYRCIFYDNTIAGKRVVQESLEKHLRSIATNT